MKPIIIHSKTKSGKRFTAVATMNGSPADYGYTRKEDCYIITVGYALCSDKDSFNKKMGRNIALGRAKRGVYKNRACEMVTFQLRNVDYRLYDYFFIKKNGNTHEAKNKLIKKIETFIENN